MPDVEPGQICAVEQQEKSIFRAVVSELMSHFSVKQLAELWGFSQRTIRRLIEDEPELVTIRRDSRNKRTYRRVQVPASVTERIHLKLTAGRH